MNALGLAATEGWEVPINPRIDPPMSTVSAPWGPNRYDGGQISLGVGPVLLFSDR